MSLVITVPKDWVAVSNSIETRYDGTSADGSRVLEEHGLEWILDSYDNRNDVAVYQFE
jgi:hypothetical protein